MAYGDHTTAHKLLAENATLSQIEAKGLYKRDDELGTVTGARLGLHLDEHIVVRDYPFNNRGTSSSARL